MAESKVSKEPTVPGTKKRKKKSKSRFPDSQPAGAVTEDPLSIEQPQLYQTLKLAQILIESGASLFDSAAKKQREELFDALKKVVGAAESFQAITIELKKYLPFKHVLEALDQLGDPYAPAILGMIWMEESLDTLKPLGDPVAVDIINAYQRSVERGFSQGLELLIWFASLSGYPQAVSQSLNPTKKTGNTDCKKLIFLLSNKVLAGSIESKILAIPRELKDLVKKEESSPYLLPKDWIRIDRLFPVTDDLLTQLTLQQFFFDNPLQTPEFTANAVAHQAIRGYFHLQKEENVEALNYFLHSAIGFSKLANSPIKVDNFINALGRSALFHVFFLLDQEPKQATSPMLKSAYYVHQKSLLTLAVEKLKLFSPEYSFYFFLAKYRDSAWEKPLSMRLDLQMFWYLLSRQKMSLMPAHLNQLTQQMNQQSQCFGVISDGGYCRAVSTTEGSDAEEFDTEHSVAPGKQKKSLVTKSKTLDSEALTILEMPFQDDFGQLTYNMHLKKLLSTLGTKDFKGYFTPQKYVMEVTAKGAKSSYNIILTLQSFQRRVDSYTRAIDYIHSKAINNEEQDHEKTFQEAMTVFNNMLALNFYDRTCIEMNWQNPFMAKYPKKDLNQSNSVLIHNTTKLLTAFRALSLRPDRPIFDKRLISMLLDFTTHGLRNSLENHLESDTKEALSQVLQTLVNPDLYADSDDETIASLVKLLMLHQKKLPDNSIQIEIYPHIQTLLLKRIKLCTNVNQLLEQLSTVIALDLPHDQLEALMDAIVENTFYILMLTMEQEADDVQKEVNKQLTKIKNDGIRQKYQNSWDDLFIRLNNVLAMERHDLEDAANAVWQEIMNEEQHRIDEAYKAYEERYIKAMSLLSKPPLTEEDDDDVQEDDDEGADKEEAYLALPNLYDTDKDATRKARKKAEDAANEEILTLSGDEDVSTIFVIFYKCYQRKYFDKGLDLLVKLEERLNKDHNPTNWVRHQTLMASIKFLMADAQLGKFRQSHPAFESLESLNRKVHLYHSGYEKAYDAYVQSGWIAFPQSGSKDDIWSAQEQLTLLAFAMTNKNNLVSKAKDNMREAIEIFEGLLGSPFSESDRKVAYSEVGLLQDRLKILGQTIGLLMDTCTKIGKTKDFRRDLLEAVRIKRENDAKTVLFYIDHTGNHPIGAASARLTEKAPIKNKQDSFKSKEQFQKELDSARSKLQNLKQALPDEVRVRVIQNALFAQGEN